MNEQKFFTETGAIAYCSNFRELRMVYGFGRALLARYARFLYIVRLWLLRESAIMLTLTENYEKVPAGSPSKVLVKPFVRSVFLKKKLENFVARRRRVITNNN